MDLFLINPPKIILETNLENLGKMSLGGREGMTLMYKIIG